MAMLITTLLAIAWIAALVLQPRWQAQRRRQIAAQSWPAAWRRILHRRVPLVRQLPAVQQQRLRQLIHIFLAEKQFIGCAGQPITDEVRLVVAAQACLPLLGNSRGYYPRLRQILVYPGAFAVPSVQTSTTGVQMEQRLVLAGQSWSQGQIILSWADVLEGAADPADGRNVVIHEFAHQLDQEKGFANGAPLLGSRAAYQRWAGTMQAAYEALRHDIDQGLPSLLNAYGASDPAEFFAVASECFFEQAQQLQREHPALYRLLADYYRIEPAAW